jgi:dienelactone hydrolase
VLSLPANAAGLVLFAHGSSSSRYNARNRYLAKALQARRLGTLLFDLLTVAEDSANLQMGGNRFDIGLLAERLSGAVNWLEQQKSFGSLPMGFFCAGTGAAAALASAANHPEQVQAVVSRGGRPDLAGEALRRVQAPTLLLVGEADSTLMGANRKALGELGCAEKKLIMVPGATYPFEDPGTLEQVAHHAAEWFCRYLGVPEAAVAADASLRV